MVAVLWELIFQWVKMEKVKIVIMCTEENKVDKSVSELLPFFPMQRSLSTEMLFRMRSKWQEGAAQAEVWEGGVPEEGQLGERPEARTGLKSTLYWEVFVAKATRA